MDGDVLNLAIYLAATFFASVVAGVTGFAFALIAAAVWLHIMTPIQVATLIAGYGMIVQLYGAWKMRHAFNWSRIWPFLVAGAPGVAVGVLVQHWANPSSIRMAIAAFLVIFSVYSLAKPALKPVRAGLAADLAVGFLSGVLGATSGFAGILVVIWVGMRGWSRDEQRGVFQPASVALLAMCGVALGVSGSITAETVRLFLIGLPVLAAGTWVGFALYGKLDDATFRKVVLMLLLASGLFLLASFR